MMFKIVRSPVSSTCASEDELQLPEMPADWASADLSEVPF